MSKVSSHPKGRPSPVCGFLLSKKLGGLFGKGSAHRTEAESFQCGASICNLLLLLEISPFRARGHQTCCLRPNMLPETCQCLHSEKLCASVVPAASHLLCHGEGCLTDGPSRRQSFTFPQEKILGAEVFAESTARPRQAGKWFYAGSFQAQCLIGEQCHHSWKGNTPPSLPRSDACLSPTSQQNDPFSWCKSR